jgi:large subunit ribosomal protein L22
MEKEMKKEKIERRTAEARLKSVKVSTIKLGALARGIKGMPVNKASMALTFSKKSVATELNKLLKSAMANAENNHGLDIDNLVIDRVDVGKSTVMKRFKAGAKGRGMRILKPFSNIRIVLIEKGE